MKIEGLEENDFKESATYVYPANAGEEGRENLLCIERRTGEDGNKPHYRVIEISYRGDAATSTHSQYAGQWLIDEDEKLDWDDIGNHSKQWESEYLTWDDLINENPCDPDSLAL